MSDERWVGENRHLNEQVAPGLPKEREDAPIRPPRWRRQGIGRDHNFMRRLAMAPQNQRPVIVVSPDIGQMPAVGRPDRLRFISGVVRNPPAQTGREVGFPDIEATCSPGRGKYDPLPVGMPLRVLVEIHRAADL